MEGKQVNKLRLTVMQHLIAITGAGEWLGCARSGAQVSWATLYVIQQRVGGLP